MTETTDSDAITELREALGGHHTAYFNDEIIDGTVWSVCSVGWTIVGLPYLRGIGRTPQEAAARALEAYRVDNAVQGLDA